MLFFFFSSRRRHTRYWRDWSSDVCSSDLGQPVAVFTGGALIVGGVARTDLADPARAQEWTRAAYGSARALLGLPADLTAYPTHGAGSFCSTGGAGERVTTIGRGKAGNPLLADADADSFTRPGL